MAIVTIDGKTAEVEDGTPILHAARGAGVDIPTFCYQKKLSPLASCRMCLVEIEGQRKLQPSCVTPVLDGMVINTETPVVKQARKAVLEFFLVNHPLDCPVCDKAGECELQDMVFAYGPRQGRFSEEKWRFHSADYQLNSVIIKNAERCIQCQRCVRICTEIVGAAALGSVGRGVNTEETGFALNLDDCDHCGNCIEVCPVGSLMNFPYRHKARPWDLTEVDTLCPHCGTGCQLTTGVRDGKLLRVRSKAEAGVNEETLCVRGRFGLDFVASGERIERPMIRKDGALAPATWEEVGTLLRPRLESIIASGRPVGGIASARLPNEDLYGFQKLMRGVFKTNNLDSFTRWSDASGSGATEAAAATVRDLYTRMPLPKFFDADAVVVVGGNVTDENPVTEYILRRLVSERAIDLFVLSCRPSRLDQEARSSARYLPGEEAVIVSRAVKNFIATLDGAEGLQQAVPGLERLERALADLGRPAATNHATFLSTLVSSLGDGRTLSFLAGTDLLRSAAGIAALRMLGNLIRILRALGKEARLQFLFDRCNQLGAWDLGVAPNLLPGYAAVNEKEERDLFEDAWQTTLPSEPGWDFARMIEHCEAGELAMLYAVGENPVLSFPDGDLTERALSKLDLLLVQDAFMTETAALADVVLPAATFGETSGTMTNNEGRVQKLGAFQKPPAEAKANGQIFTFLASLLGHNAEPLSPEGAFEELAKLVPPYQGLAYDALGLDGQTTTSQGNRRQAGLDVPEVVGPGEGEGFRLITGNCLYHSGYVSASSEVLSTIAGEPYVEMSGDDARDLGLQDQDGVVVQSDGNSVRVKVKINESFSRGVVFIPENFKELRLNRLLKAGEYPCRVDIQKG